MSQRQIFKIAILSHDSFLFERLFDVFGVDFEKAMTQTSGASFSYSHFDMEDGQRLTAQFWMLDGSPQWSSIRNLYMKGASGIIILHDPTVKNATEINRRLLKEFVSVNRFQIPIIILNVEENIEQLSKSTSFAKDIARWRGYEVTAIGKDTTEIDDILTEFMTRVKDWQARNVIFQTLKLYFNLDAINAEKRSISKIITQLRKIYTSQYYELLSDKEIFNIVRQAILIEGFDYNSEEKAIVYSKPIKTNPWTDYEDKLGPDEYNKPKVEKL